MITGKTTVYAHIGHPISHVRAPELYNALFAERGLDIVMVPVHVTHDSLAAATAMFRRWRNLVGVGVTIPHKESMLTHVDELTDMARLCGATNVIARRPDGSLIGGQFDGLGFVSSVLETGRSVAGASVLVAGAGGTAKAICFALAKAGANRLAIQNRTAVRARELAASVGAAFPHCDLRPPTRDERFDIVVNATSLGMRENDELPVPEPLLVPPTLVCDVVMAPPMTRLLSLAVDRGCAINEGKNMLLAQFRDTLTFLSEEGGI